MKLPPDRSLQVRGVRGSRSSLGRDEMKDGPATAWSSRQHRTLSTCSPRSRCGDVRRRAPSRCASQPEHGSEKDRLRRGLRRVCERSERVERYLPWEPTGGRPHGPARHSRRRFAQLGVCHRRQAAHRRCGRRCMTLSAQHGRLARCGPRSSEASDRLVPKPFRRHAYGPGICVARWMRRHRPRSVHPGLRLEAARSPPKPSSPESVEVGPASARTTTGSTGCPLMARLTQPGAREAWDGPSRAPR